MDKENHSEILKHHGIRPTAIRILVYRAMAKIQNTFSMTDLETVLETVDRSSIFRTLTLFSQRHLVHEIEDGSGSKKYCLCHNDHICNVDELHCHFYCEVCHKTFCLDYTHIPIVPYPVGFELRGIDYLLRGVCADCRRKQHV